MTVDRLIGLLGGTFDPVHFGHLLPARRAKQQLGLDELRLLPCNRPVHRPPPLANAVQRVKMLELALQDFPELRLDTRELERDEPSFSFNTLSSLHRDIPDAAFCWMLGMDAFHQFDQWHRWREVLGLTHLLVTHRPGVSAGLPDALDIWLQQYQVQEAEALRRSPSGAILILELDAPDISSTALRRRLAAGESVDGQIPRPVLQWLQQNPIYAA